MTQPQTPKPASEAAPTPGEAPPADQPQPPPEPPAPKADPKETHVVQEWKHDSPLICCRFDPQGRYVLASAEDSSVQRWHLESGAKTPMVGHESWVRGITFCDGGNTAVTAGSEGRLIWWPVEAEQPQPARTVEAHKGWIRCIATSPDGNVIASAGNDRTVRLWNAADGAPVGELTGHECDIYSVLYHPGGELLLSGDLKGHIKVWELSTGNALDEFDATKLHSYNKGQQVDFGGVRTMALSADTAQLAAGGLFNASNPLGAVHDPIVLRFERESKKLLQSHIAEGLKGIAWRVIFHVDGPLIGVSGGSSGGFLLFWNADEEKEFHRFKLPNLARDMDLHPDGLRLATAHYDQQLRISSMTPKAAG